MTSRTDADLLGLIRTNDPLRPSLVHRLDTAIMCNCITLKHCFSCWHSDTALPPPLSLLFLSWQPTLVFWKLVTSSPFLSLSAAQPPLYVNEMQRLVLVTADIQLANKQQTKITASSLPAQCIEFQTWLAWYEKQIAPPKPSFHYIPHSFSTLLSAKLCG
ncbi:hypothetical protein K457DRAFT_843909 [Linnemannia elongata AG-77]|uniref:Uncharacterized protein n=1 Tax=Linnemannia elongata AG-77 TaxID=1314771 RepID=A0A197JJ05_9FUNG|nr:hypothetical protein K457DRAFT_843909 [Linnemannia elongata AG-77]